MLFTRLYRPAIQDHDELDSICSELSFLAINELTQLLLVILMQSVQNDVVVIKVILKIDY